MYYHFTSDKLRDGSAIPPIGEWLVFEGEPEPCERGLHASPDAFDALQYAPGNLLHQVELAGGNVEIFDLAGNSLGAKWAEIQAHGNPADKYVAPCRRILATIDAEPIMRLFARRVALDVIHLWNAPAIVKEYLESGDESKRAAAGDAARDAATDAAWDAAWDAARDAARDAAGDAVRAAAWDAAWAAAGDAARDAATDAAWDAAWDAKQKLYRGWFNEMVEAAFALQSSKEASK